MVRAVKSQQGKPGRYRGFGFESDATTVRESEAVYIRKAFRMALQGKSYEDIKKWLHEQGPEARPTSGEEWWSTNGIRHLLRAPRIAGYATARGGIVGDLPGEPIVDPEEWKRFQSLQAEKTKPGRPRLRSVCGGTVKCGDCKVGTLTAAEAQNGVSYADGSPQYRYRCKNCNKSMGDMRAIDRRVRTVAISRLSSREHQEFMELRAKKEKTAREPHEQKLEHLKSLRRMWDDQVKDGAISAQRHTELTHDMAPRIAEEEQKLQDLYRGTSATRLPDKEEAQNASQKWDAEETTNEERREMLKQALLGAELMVDPGRLRDVEHIKDRVHLVQFSET